MYRSSTLRSAASAVPPSPDALSVVGHGAPGVTNLRSLCALGAGEAQCRTVACLGAILEDSASAKSLRRRWMVGSLGKMFVGWLIGGDGKGRQDSEENPLTPIGSIGDLPARW